MHPRLAALCIALASTLAGCGGVFSTAPASEASALSGDDRLVGFWRVDLDASHADPATRSDAVVAVGHRSKTDARLRVATLLLEGTTLSTVVDDVVTTTVAEKPYASLQPSDAKPDAPPSWVVLRYDMPDADTLRVLGMDVDAVAADVLAKKVAGRVDAATGDGGAAPRTVALDVATATLRAYLEARGDAVYATGRPLVLRRLAR